MPTDPFTPAELEAGRRAVLEADPSETRPVAHTYAVLAAVAPLIAARVRAEAAEEIADDIVATIIAGIAMPMDLRPPSGGRPPVSAYAAWAARIARAHRTTPGDDDA